VNIFFTRFSVCFTDFHTRIIAMKDDLEPEQQQEDKEPFNKLSELDLLTSHYLENELPIILEKLLCSDHIMTAELWEW